MRRALLLLLAMTGCTSVPSAEPAASEPEAAAPEASDMSDLDAATDAPVDAPADAACPLTVDEAGVTHGCGKGDNGPGDRDDGGGSAAPPPPDAAPDAMDLPFGASCLDNEQCSSDLCFLYTVRGQFCTLACMSNADCPPPSLGCNGMGVCRLAN
jgi:hypothetical protein